MIADDTSSTGLASELPKGQSELLKGQKTKQLISRPSTAVASIHHPSICVSVLSPQLGAEGKEETEIF